MLRINTLATVLIAFGLTVTVFMGYGLTAHLTAILAVGIVVAMFGGVIKADAMALYGASIAFGALAPFDFLGTAVPWLLTLISVVAYIAAAIFASGRNDKSFGRCLLEGLPIIGLIGWFVPERRRSSSIRAAF